jgi:hypothetical protein
MKTAHFIRLLPVAGLLCGCKPASPAGNGKATTVSASTFTVKSLTAERSGPHVHLTIAALVKNPGATALTLTPPAAQLFAGAKSVEPFIAPGLEPAVIPAGGEAEVATHWWLAAGDLSGALTLDIAGARAEVKSAAAFALDLLPENRPVALSFPDWKLP